MVLNWLNGTKVVPGTEVNATAPPSHRERHSSGEQQVLTPLPDSAGCFIIIEDLPTCFKLRTRVFALKVLRGGR